MEYIGLIPAGGSATRLGNAPCSKEVFPYIDSRGNISVLSSNLIGYYKAAGITEIYFIIKKGKWDIPGYFGDGTDLGVNTGYLIMNSPYGVPFTLRQAYPFVRDKMVALGFPDILLRPQDAFLKLREKAESTSAEIVLGIMPHPYPERADMVEIDNGKITGIVIKQPRKDLNYSWVTALWRPSFTAYLHKVTGEYEKSGQVLLTDGNLSREIYIGDIIDAAIKDGMRTDYVLFEDGYYIDTGSPDEMKKFLTGEGDFFNRPDAAQ